MRYLPIGALVGFILLAELVLVFGSWVIAPGVAGLAGGADCRRRGRMTNTRALGDLLYTRYIFAFQAAGMILLVAMIGAIVLTLRQRVGVRRRSRSRSSSRAPAPRRSRSSRCRSAAARPSGRRLMRWRSALRII